VRGPGILVRGKTDAKGVYRRSLRPNRPGIISITVAGTTGCSTSLGAVGVFQPPVTG
jgi:hypothetical protein